MKNLKDKLLWFVPLTIFVVALLFILINTFAHHEVIVTGMVETKEIDVASKIPGRIDSLLVREGEQVKKGQLLAILQSKEIDAKVLQAKSVMEAARAQYEMALNGARPEEKEAVQKLYLQAKHQFEFARKTYQRMQKVYKDSVVAQQTMDEIEFKYRAAKEQMEAAQAKYQMVLKGARQEQIKAAEALFHQAEGAYREALAYKEETRLYSPIDGQVQTLVADAGEIIAAGYPIVTLIDPADSWAVFHLREDQLVGVKAGQIVKGFVPALKKELEFKITYLADMGDFATWRATNQKGDFDLKTFEVHARPVKAVDGLRAGMTVQFKIDEIN
ncbi:HlyD family secretion protein [Caldithrix abyssi]